MARYNYLEEDSELNWLQFLDNNEMQPLLFDNLFAYGLMEDSFPSALLGLPPNLLQQSSRIGCSEILAAAETANVNITGDFRQHNHSAMTSWSNSNLTGINPATDVLSAFPSDAAFVERAAKCLSFERENCTDAEENTAETVTSGNSKERALESTMSRNDAKNICQKKRKAARKATESAEGKRTKHAVEKSKQKEEHSNNYIGEEKIEENNVKAPPTPPEKQNYIHVRARRGQAIDSHSLAERARRKIFNERMKFLQHLVPGCSKIRGKILMLDAIINHVLCLQRQVEFLSMKTAMANRLFDLDIIRFCHQDITTNCPQNGGIYRDLTSSPCLEYEQLDQLNVSFPTAF